MDGQSEKVAVVVGGGSGIGEASLHVLADQGWNVVVGDLNAEAAARVAGEIVDLGHEAVSVAIDITDSASVDSAMRDAAGKWGTLDAVIPCAGVIAPMPSEEIDDESLIRMLDIHLVGTIRCARAAFPYLLKSPAPSIVAVSSVAARIGIPQRLSYAAAKGGVEAVVRTLAVEWAHYNIRVNAVAPGWVRTPMIARAIEEGRLDAATLENLSPFERLARSSSIDLHIPHCSPPRTVLIWVAVRITATRVNARCADAKDGD